MDPVTAGASVGGAKVAVEFGVDGGDPPTCGDVMGEPASAVARLTGEVTTSGVEQANTAREAIMNMKNRIMVFTLRRSYLLSQLRD